MLDKNKIIPNFLGIFSNSSVWLIIIPNIILKIYFIMLQYSTCINPRKPSQ